MAKRTEQHEINDAAKSVFESLITKKCALAIISVNDYGVDYKGQIFKNEEPAGVEIFIQLKGRTKDGRGKHCKDYISYPLEVSTLIDCLKTWPLPAFLVVVDLEDKAAYYCFLQDYIYQHLEGIKWETQKTINVKCPYTNFLADHASFLTACDDATQFMVAHKIRLEQWRLQKLDPRFSVEISATATHTNYTCTPIKPVEFAVTFKDMTPEMLDKFSKGYEIPVSPESCTVKGAPLFEIKKVGTIKFANEDRTSVTLVARAANGNELLAIPRIEGLRTRAQKESRFESNDDSAVLHLGVVVEKDSGSMELSFKFKAWYNCPLLRLNRFDEVVKIADAVVEGAVFSIEGFAESELVIGAIPDREVFVTLQGFLRFLKRARELAEHFNVKPKLPRMITKEHEQDILRLWELAAKGSVTEIVNGNFTVTVPNNPPTDYEIISPVGMTLENWRISLFDTPIVFKLLRKTFEGTKVKDVQQSKEGYFKILFSIIDHSKMVLENLDTTLGLLPNPERETPLLPPPPH